MWVIPLLAITNVRIIWRGDSQCGFQIHLIFCYVEEPTLIINILFYLFIFFSSLIYNFGECDSHCVVCALPRGWCVLHKGCCSDAVLVELSNVLGCNFPSISRWWQYAVSEARCLRTP